MLHVRGEEKERKKKRRHVRIAHTYPTVPTFVVILVKRNTKKLVIEDDFVFYENVDRK